MMSLCYKDIFHRFLLNSTLLPCIHLYLINVLVCGEKYCFQQLIHKSPENVNKLCLKQDLTSQPTFEKQKHTWKSDSCSLPLAEVACALEKLFTTVTPDIRLISRYPAIRSVSQVSGYLAG